MSRRERLRGRSATRSLDRATARDHTDDFERDPRAWIGGAACGGLKRLIERSAEVERAKCIDERASRQAIFGGGIAGSADRLGERYTRSQRRFGRAQQVRRS